MNGVSRKGSVLLVTRGVSALFALWIADAVANGIMAQTNSGPTVTDANGCAMVLQPVQIVSRDDRDFAFNYVSATRSSDASANIGVILDVVPTLGFDSHNFTQNVSQNIHQQEHKEFAAKWLSSDQLKAYVECLKLKRPLSAWFESWTEGRVTIKVQYNPAPPITNANIQIPLRSVIKLRGVRNPGQQMASIPQYVGALQTALFSLDRTPGVEIVVDIPFQGGDPVSLVLPATPRSPCIGYDDHGHCAAQAVEFQFGPGTASQYEVPIPAEWKNRAVSVEMTAIVRRTSNDTGSAGNLTYLLTTGPNPDQYTITNIPPMSGNGAPGVEAFNNRWIVNAPAKGVASRSFKISQVRCWGQNSPSTEQSSCTVSGAFLLVPN